MADDNSVQINENETPDFNDDFIAFVDEWYSEMIDENFVRTEQSIGPKCHGPYGGEDQ